MSRNYEVIIRDSFLQIVLNLFLVPRAVVAHIFFVSKCKTRAYKRIK
jgi:hypothetical protein